MKIDCPLPHLDGFKLVAIHFSDENIILQLRPKRKSAVCPLCHHRSSALHSSYIRTLADLPLGGKALSLSVEVRRFRCYQAACSRKIFCERLPQLTRPHARTTLPMSEALQQIGVALGGQSGSHSRSPTGDTDQSVHALAPGESSPRHPGDLRSGIRGRRLGAAQRTAIRDGALRPAETTSPGIAA